MADEGYDLTIHGLLRKRTELLASLESYRDKVAATANDIRSVDRVLTSLAYEGELDLLQPRKRVLNYIKHEVRRFILDELRALDANRETGVHAFGGLGDGRGVHDLRGQPMVITGDLKVGTDAYR